MGLLCSRPSLFPASHNRHRCKTTCLMASRAAGSDSQMRHCMTSASRDHNRTCTSWHASECSLRLVLLFFHSKKPDHSLFLRYLSPLPFLAVCIFVVLCGSDDLQNLGSTFYFSSANLCTILSRVFFSSLLYLDTLVIPIPPASPASTRRRESRVAMLADFLLFFSFFYSSSWAPSYLFFACLGVL